MREKYIVALLLFVIPFAMLTGVAGVEIEVVADKPGKGFKGSYKPVNFNDEAQNAGASTLSESLERINGVRINRSGPPGTQSSLMLRGASATQSEVFLEGIALGDPYGGGFNLENLPTDLFNTAELYFSNTPMHLPGANIGGALDLRLALPEQGQVILLKNAANSLIGGHTSVGWSRPTYLHYVELKGSLNQYVYRDDGGTPFFNKLDDSEKIRNNEDFLQGGYTGFMRFDIGGAQINWLIDTFLKEQGLPGVVGHPSKEVRLQSQRFLTALSSNTPLGTSWLLQNQLSVVLANTILNDPKQELATGVSSQSRNTLQNTISSSVLWYSKYAEMRMVTQARLANVWQNKSQYVRHGETDFALGIDLFPWPQYGHLNGSAKATYVNDVPHKKTLLQIEQHQRYDWLPTLSSRLGIYPMGFFQLRHPQKLELYGEISYSQRPPSIAELYGDGALLLPAPLLKNETGLTNALGLISKISCGVLSCHFRLAYFLTAMEDLIMFIANSQQTMLAVNASRAQLEGVESDFQIAYRQYVNLSLNYTYLDAVEKGKTPYYYNRYLPYRPRHSFFFTAEGGLLQIRFFTTAEYTGRNYRDRYNSWYLFLDSRIRFSAGLNYLFGEQLNQKLTFTVKNISDERQVDIIGYPLPGRVFEVAYQAKLFMNQAQP